ncbi:glycosyltransferase [Adlercreutzia sp. ZJ473]|uniref:glycosyltransferase n=1 Tax=Adlercreutzia sp. ZJ473 TaxID=2722822 RepID=UPI0015577680
MAIFQTDFRVGGIQRSLLTLLRSDVFRHDEVDLYLFSKDYEQASELPVEVNRIFLEPLPYLCRLAPFDFFGVMVDRYRRVLPRLDYDLSIDFNGYSPDCAAAAMATDAGSRIIWVHNDYGERMRYDKRFKVSFSLGKRKFKRFDSLVAVSEGSLDSIQVLLGKEIPSTQYVIPNLIDAEELFCKAAEEEVSFSSDLIKICGMGRLDKIKGFDLLIKDFALAREKNEDISLFIIGDGPERRHLERLAYELGVSDSVIFLGKLENPYPALAAMDAFCHEALYEGQGLVIREAQAFGLDVVVPKRLEKYNKGISGCECVSDVLAGLKKTAPEKRRDSLDSYNRSIKAEFGKIRGGI